MGSGWSRSERWCALLVLTLLFFAPRRRLPTSCTSSPNMEGATIQGRAYFPGDVPARKSDVIARDPSAANSAARRRTTTASSPSRPTSTSIITCVAETPDGHGGQYIVHATELPDSLPAGVPTAGNGSQVASPATDHRPAGRSGGQGERTGRGQGPIGGTAHADPRAPPANLRIRRASPLSRHFRRHRFYPRACRRGFLHEGPAENVG